MSKLETGDWVLIRYDSEEGKKFYHTCCNEKKNIFNKIHQIEGIITSSDYVLYSIKDWFFPEKVLKKIKVLPFIIPT